MKKLFLFGLLLVLGLGLLACNNTKVNKEELIKEVNSINLTLQDVQVVESVLEPTELELGTYFIPTSVKTSVDDAIDSANKVIQDKKAPQKEVDQELDKLKRAHTQIIINLTVGLYFEEVEISLQGAQAAADRLRQALFGVLPGTDASEIKRGAKFAPIKLLNDTKNVLQEEENKINQLKKNQEDPVNPVEPTPEELQAIIDKLRQTTIEFVSKIELGTKQSDETIVYKDDYIVNLETLNLNGATIPYFSHVGTEDNPFSTSFDSTSIDRLDYMKFLKDLETKYNFKFDFQGYKNYDTMAVDMSVFLRGFDGAAIMRIPETKLFMDNIKSGNLHPFSSVVGSLKQQYQDKYEINDWQIARGTVGGKVFGIQRNDGVTYPDLMMFNRNLIAQYAPGSKMPDEMWEDGEWTFDNFKALVNKINNGIQDQQIKALGITPYYLGINAVQANGIELVDVTKPTIEQQLNINKTEVISILSEYTNQLFKGQNAPGIWYNKSNTQYTPDFLAKQSVNKNHLFDKFKAGEIVIATFQNWQASSLSGVSFEASIVPYPQMGHQDNSKYISPIESGDILAVTRGNNHFEVATILMLINGYMKNVQKNLWEQERINFSLPEGTDLELIMAASFVKEKTINTKTEDIERARMISAFIHGYGAENKQRIRLSDLPSLAADDLYAFAIQEHLYKGTDFKAAIDSQIERIKSEYQKVFDLLKNFE